MRITWKELTISPSGVDLPSLLSEWRWLVNETYEPVVISALGDLFLRDAAGQIFWLDVAWGELTQVAVSGEEFKQLMVQPDNANQWFVPQLVGDLLASGKHLGPGECFSYVKPPILGGKIEPDNFEATDLQVHFSVLGQIHRQVKDLPPGTPISAIQIE